MTAVSVPLPDVDESRLALDAAVMTRIAEQHWAPLVRLASLLLGDRPGAEEAVQEAFEATWRRQPRLRDESHLLAYLRTAVVNRSRSAGRRRSVARRHLALARIDHEPPADVDLLAQEDQREMRAALAALPPRQREVLVLRYWSRLSEADIAQTLDISAGTVKSTAHRALAALRAQLKDPS